MSQSALPFQEQMEDHLQSLEIALANLTICFNRLDVSSSNLASSLRDTRPNHKRYATSLKLISDCVRINETAAAASPEFSSSLNEEVSSSTLNDVSLVPSIVSSRLAVIASSIEPSPLLSSSIEPLSLVTSSSSSSDRTLRSNSSNSSAPQLDVAVEQTDESTENVVHSTSGENLSPVPEQHPQDDLLKALITVVISDLHVGATVRGNAITVLDCSTNMASKSLDSLDLIRSTLLLLSSFRRPEPAGGVTRQRPGDVKTNFSDTNEMLAASFTPGPSQGESTSIPTTPTSPRSPVSLSLDSGAIIRDDSMS